MMIKQDIIKKSSQNRRINMAGESNCELDVRRNELNERQGDRK